MIRGVVLSLNRLIPPLVLPVLLFVLSQVTAATENTVFSGIPLNRTAVTENRHLSERAIRARRRPNETPALRHHGHSDHYSMPVPRSYLVDSYHALFSSPERHDYLSRIRNRWEPYRDYIAERIESHGLPPELLYLPAVESAYRPGAVSRTGAVGLWQFMPGSAAPFGLRMTELVDERMDFMKSTEAALRKLAYNRDVLDDWLLAIAAYNCGLARIRRIVAKTGLQDFWELAEGGHLPAETTGFVPLLVVYSEFFGNSVRHGFDYDWNSVVRWETVAVTSPLHIELLAGSTGLDSDILQIGNPELLRGIALPGHMLKVPPDSADAVRDALRRTKNRFQHVHAHTISSGDTLYDLAIEYGISVALIELFNPGILPRRLQIGSKVYIPNIDGGRY